MRISNKTFVYVWLPSDGFVPAGVLLVEEEGGAAFAHEISVRKGIY